MNFQPIILHPNGPLIHWSVEQLYVSSTTGQINQIRCYDLLRQILYKKYYIEDKYYIKNNLRIELIFSETRWTYYTFEEKSISTRFYQQKWIYVCLIRQSKQVKWIVIIRAYNGRQLLPVNKPLPSFIVIKHKSLGVRIRNSWMLPVLCLYLSRLYTARLTVMLKQTNGQLSFCVVKIIITAD